MVDLDGGCAQLEGGCIGASVEGSEDLGWNWSRAMRGHDV